MGFESTLMIFERHGNLKYKYGNRHFWCKGYYVSTVGRNKTAIAKYIEKQLKENMMSEYMTMKEYTDQGIASNSEAIGEPFLSALRCHTIRIPLWGS